MGPTGLREISSLAVGVGATYGLGVGAGGMYTVSPVSLPETLLAVVDGAAVDVGVVVVGFGLLITASGSSVTGTLLLHLHLLPYRNRRQDDWPSLTRFAALRYGLYVGYASPRNLNTHLRLRFPFHHFFQFHLQ